jgi:peptidyl-prolyl cis-trans isomerase D
MLEYQWIRIFHLKTLELKLVMLKKSGQGLLLLGHDRVWDQEVSIALLTTEFEELGLRLVVKHFLEF